MDTNKNKKRFKFQYSGETGTGNNVTPGPELMPDPGVNDYGLETPLMLNPQQQQFDDTMFSTQYDQFGVPIGVDPTPYNLLPDQPSTEKIVHARDIDEGGGWAAFNPYMPGRMGGVMGTDHRMLRAKNQSEWEQFTNSTMQTLLGIPLGLMENTGVLGGLLIDGYDYENSLSKWARGAREDLTESYPVYRENPNKVLDYGDPAFWMQHGFGLLESVIEFGITAVPMGMFAGGGALGVARALQMGARAQKAFGALAGVGITAGGLAYVEGAMSGAHVFDRTYQLQRKRGASEEEALERASKAAATTTRMNTAFNTVLNLTSVGPLFRSNKTLLRDMAGFKSQLKQLPGETAEEAAERIGKLTYTPDRWGAAAAYTAEGLQESAEEVINVWSEKTGEAIGAMSDEEYAAKLIGEKFLALEEAGNHIGEVWSEEGFLSAVLGFLGGVGQKYLMEHIPTYKDEPMRYKEEHTMLGANGEDMLVRPGDYVYDEDGNPVMEKGWFGTSRITGAKKLHTDREIAFNRVKLQLSKDLVEVDKKLNELHSIIENTDGLPTVEVRKRAQEKRIELFNLNLYNAYHLGMGEQLKNTFIHLRDTDNTNILKDELNPEIQALETKLNALQGDPEGNANAIEKLQYQLNKLKEQKAQGVTRAMMLGLTESMQDNAYKEVAQRSIDTITDMQGVYNELMDRYDYGDPESFHFAKEAFRLKATAYAGRHTIKQHQALYDAELERVKKEDTEFKLYANAQMDSAIDIAAKISGLDSHIAFLEFGKTKKGKELADHLALLKTFSNQFAIKDKDLPGKITDTKMEDDYKKLLEEIQEEYIKERDALKTQKKSAVEALLADYLEEGVSAVDATEAQLEIAAKKANEDLDKKLANNPKLTQHMEDILKARTQVEAYDKAYNRITFAKGREEFIKLSKEYWEEVYKLAENNVNTTEEGEQAPTTPPISQEASDILKAITGDIEKEEEAGDYERVIELVRAQVNDTLDATDEDKALLAKYKDLAAAVYNYLRQESGDPEAIYLRGVREQDINAQEGARLSEFLNSIYKSLAGSKENTITLKDFMARLQAFKAMDGEGVSEALEGYERMIEHLIAISETNGKTAKFGVYTKPPKELSDTTPAWYDPTDNSINITLGLKGTKGFRLFRSSFVHEMVHSIIKNELKTKANIIPLVNDLRDFLKSLGKGNTSAEVIANLLEDLKKEIDAVRGKDITKENILRGAYSALNYIGKEIKREGGDDYYALEEIVTQAFEDPDFAAWLASIKSDEAYLEDSTAKGNISLWSKIKSLILDLVSVFVPKSKLQELNNILDKHVPAFVEYTKDEATITPGTWIIEGTPSVVYGIRGGLVVYNGDINKAMGDPSDKYMTVEKFLRLKSEGQVVETTGDTINDLKLRIASMTDPSQEDAIVAAIEDAAITGNDLKELQDLLAKKVEELRIDNQEGLIEATIDTIKNIKDIGSLTHIDILGVFNNIATTDVQKGKLMSAINETIEQIFKDTDMHNAYKLLLIDGFADKFGLDYYTNTFQLLKKHFDNKTARFVEELTLVEKFEEIAPIIQRFEEFIKPFSKVVYGGKHHKNVWEPTNTLEETYQDMMKAHRAMVNEAKQDLRNAQMVAHNATVDEYYTREDTEIAKQENERNAEIEALETELANLKKELKELRGEKRGMAGKDTNEVIDRLLQAIAALELEIKEKKRQYKDLINQLKREVRKAGTRRHLVQLQFVKDGREYDLGLYGPDGKKKKVNFNSLYEVVQLDGDQYTLLSVSDPDNEDYHITVPKEYVYDFQQSKTRDQGERENIYSAEYFSKMFIHATDKKHAVPLSTLQNELRFIAPALKIGQEVTKNKYRILEYFDPFNRKFANDIVEELKTYLDENPDATPEEQDAVILELADRLHNTEFSSSVRFNTQKVITNTLWRLQQEGRSLMDNVKFEIRKDISIDKNKEIRNKLINPDSAKEKLEYGLLHANPTKLAAADKNGTPYIGIHNWEDIDVAIYINTAPEFNPDGSKADPDWYYVGNPQNPNTYHKVNPETDTSEVYHPGILLTMHERATTEAEKQAIRAEFTRLYSTNSGKRLLKEDLEKIGKAANEQAKLFSVLSDIHKKVGQDVTTIPPALLQQFMTIEASGGSFNFKTSRAEREAGTAEDFFFNKDGTIKESTAKFLIDDEIIILDNKVHYDSLDQVQDEVEFDNDGNPIPITIPLQGDAFFEPDQVDVTQIKDPKTGMPLDESFDPAKLAFKKNRYWALIKDVSGQVRPLALKPRNANKDEIELFLKNLHDYIAKKNESLKEDPRGLGNKELQAEIFKSLQGIVDGTGANVEGDGLFLKFHRFSNHRVTVHLDVDYNAKTSKDGLLSPESFILNIKSSVGKKNSVKIIRGLNFTDYNMFEGSLKGAGVSLSNFGVNIPKDASKTMTRKEILNKLKIDVKDEAFKANSLYMSTDTAKATTMVDAIKAENEATKKKPNVSRKKQPTTSKPGKKRHHEKNDVGVQNHLRDSGFTFFEGAESPKGNVEYWRGIRDATIDVLNEAIANKEPLVIPEEISNIMHKPSWDKMDPKDITIDVLNMLDIQVSTDLDKKVSRGDIEVKFSDPSQNIEGVDDVAVTEEVEEALEEEETKQEEGKSLADQYFDLKMGFPEMAVQLQILLEQYAGDLSFAVMDLADVHRQWANYTQTLDKKQNYMNFLKGREELKDPAVQSMIQELINREDNKKRGQRPERISTETIQEVERKLRGCDA
jgi:hypothetical protein